MKLKKLKNSESGFTLIEFVLAVAISGIIIAAITTTILQMFTGGARTSSHMTAVRQVQSAGYWVSRDGMMAQEEPDIGGDPSTNFLTLTWTDWGSEDKDEHKVVYTLKDMTDGDLKNLQRIYSGPVATETGIIAQYIDPYQTSCVWDSGVLTFTVTATVGEQSETRVYEVKPRPGS